MNSKMPNRRKFKILFDKKSTSYDFIIMTLAVCTSALQHWLLVCKA